MASKKSKAKEPLASLTKFIKACRQVEAKNQAFTAGETLFGTAIDSKGEHHKSKMAEMLDALLGELKDWNP